mmetsp:Transcript_46322/g.149317  ORF Transcript_46322/g.149317 Transcript_46322/m.149317 type:complete len:206 (-) Transcript_46322:143-760(-)
MSAFAPASSTAARHGSQPPRAASCAALQPRASIESGKAYRRSSSCTCFLSPRPAAATSGRQCDVDASCVASCCSRAASSGAPSPSGPALAPASASAASERLREDSGCTSHDLPATPPATPLAAARREGSRSIEARTTRASRMLRTASGSGVQLRTASGRNVRSRGEPPETASAASAASADAFTAAAGSSRAVDTESRSCCAPTSE